MPTGAPAAPPPLPALRFGDVELLPAQRAVRVGGQPVPLGSRAFDLLMALVDHRERAVSKDELLTLAWPGLVVEENNLSVQVSALRKALGANAIATLPGRGYRFTLAETGLSAAERGLPVSPPAGAAAQAPALIGRDADLTAVGSLIGRHRLVTLCGIGGIGKTCLARSLLPAQQDRFPDGVVWVDLEALSDPSWVAGRVAGAVAGALGLRLGPGDEALELSASLGPLRLLIVLDNAEHLIDAVARLAARLIELTSGLHLLVTSQVPLRVAAEQLYRLEPLDVPTVDIDPAQALHAAAVRLFLERAAQAGRRMPTTTDDVAAVARLCRKLDGVPLAIELAATRAPLLGFARLESALDEQLALLTTGHRDAPARQRSLRAALEWSHALLGADECTVLRRLGVFAGGFGLEMALEVVAGDGATMDRWSALDALGALVDHSLVDVVDDQGPRYRLLDSTRQFALERLHAAGETAATRRRHADAVAHRFMAIDEACLSGRMLIDDAVSALEPDWDNAREALSWLVSNGERDRAAQLCPALNMALTMSRQAERAWVWATTAACVDASTPAPVRALWALGYAGYSYSRQPLAAMVWAREAVGHFRATGAAVNLYRALGILSCAAARAGDGPACQAALEEMVAVEDPAWPARLRFYRASAEWQHAALHEQADAVHSALKRMYTLAQDAGDSTNAHHMLAALIDSELALGHTESAVRHGHELERRLASGRHQSALAYARVNLTAALMAAGALDEARAMAQVAWPIALRFGIQHILANHLASLALADGRAQDAALLSGYCDAGYAARGEKRVGTEAASTGATQSRLRQLLADSELERLRVAGAALADAQAFALAFGPLHPDPGGRSTTIGGSPPAS